jgi:hypothetical protein
MGTKTKRTMEAVRLYLQRKINKVRGARRE